MKNKFLILILIGLVLNINAYGQWKKNEKINQLTENGQREGFWVDTTSSQIYEKYYINGIISGIYKEYNTNGRLQIFGEYDKGKMSGIWYYFDNIGRLVMIFKDFDKNTNSIINGNGKRFIPDYKCYFISYYPNGNIESEGTLLWSEGEWPVSDLSREYGEWKYYDDKGNLIKTKEFK